MPFSYFVNPHIRYVLHPNLKNINFAFKKLWGISSPSSSLSIIPPTPIFPSTTNEIYQPARYLPSGQLGKGSRGLNEGLT